MKVGIEDKIGKRIGNLISCGGSLKQGNEHGQIRDEKHRQECAGWLVSAQNIVHLMVRNPSNPYRMSVDTICGSDQGYAIPGAVGEVRIILQSLLEDIDSGLLASVKDQAMAFAFDGFLDHAKEYLKQKHPKEAGVIAGVVFEDTLRNIYRNTGEIDKGLNLDNLISEFVKEGVFNSGDAARARVAAHLRNKATHAQWDEFNHGNVNDTIVFTEELMHKYLEY